MKGEQSDGHRCRSALGGRARGRVGIVVVGSDVLFLDLLEEWVDRFQGLRVIGRASDARSAVALIERLSPEMAVCHLCHTARRGAGTEELAREAVRRGWRTRLIAIVCSGKADRQARELTAADRVIISSSKGISGLLRAVENMLPGERVCRRPVLTARQRQVLTMVGLGWTSKRIARELGLSRRTVDTHRSNIMKRLGVNSVAEMVSEALRRGLIH